MKTSLFSNPTPFTPPTTEDDRLSILRLIRSRRVGPTTFHRLMAEHGSAQAALAELPAIARAAKVSDYAPCPEHLALDELTAGQGSGAQLICYGTPEYPQALAKIDDAPPVLWALGDITLLHRPALAIIGARNASSLGLRMARSLAADLGQKGFVITSGLARGIDTAAHQAALDTGTIAVQACGIDVIYPRENDALAQEIAQQGLRLSENPPGLQPQARHFPQRNRIISGLSQATIVVEAAHRSGSLLTARDALDQGRDVLAVPGHPFDARAAGGNMLIRDGAALIRNAEDVIAALSATPTPSQQRPTPTQSTTAHSPAPPKPPNVTHQHSTQPPSTPSLALREQILGLLGPSPVTQDSVIRDLQISATEFSREIVLLELSGAVIQHPGGLISKAV
ncbi:DNA protecting protein DprA [Thioclava sp. SK-1]|uniref:DNA-processing protein DprA n=1 Tax=Thioclava sp. SK-1 TaxID=1889770 RepID=UPI00082683D3|nr:DNA-processing protein DprA [Thioclava sp. SK-1]OCX65911.1 DNA protecting protein DprA [Thioclava sp. SK-1]